MAGSFLPAVIRDCASCTLHTAQKTIHAALPHRADGGQCVVGGHTWESAIIFVGIFVVLLMGDGGREHWLVWME